MPFFYQTGEEIKKGDRVTLFEQPSEVEFVAELPGDAETRWHVQEFGGGVMVVETMPKNLRSNVLN